MKKTFTNLVIPSRIDNLYKVEKFVDEVCENFYITNTYYGNILMSVLEAVRNAILHGNFSKEEKSVIVSFKIVKNGLSFTIKDEGNGFNYRLIGNPIEIMGEDQTFYGKGLFLIHSLADKVNFNKKGNVIEIIFLISSLNQETTLDRIKKIQGYFRKQKLLK